MNRIYHYTTLKNLELILSNATIRLTSLDQMDDLLEGSSVDFGSLSPYFFVSSWSDNQDESIPLWYMYTDKMRGVRIEADENFLQLEQDYKDGHVLNITDPNLIAYKIVHGKKDSFLCKVKYTDTLTSCLETVRGYINENIDEIGKTKPTAWSFQHEVRFRIYGIHRNYLVSYGDNLNIKVWNSMYAFRNNPIKYVDVKFDIGGLNNANFMLGPAATVEDTKTLKHLIMRYLPDYVGNVQLSDLKIRFKDKD